MYGVAFSPRGKLPAVGDGDSTVRLWNPATGRLVATLQTHTGPNTGVYGMAFSPNGKLLASVGNDATVRLWHASLFAHAYPQLCTDVGPPTPQEWDRYAFGEPQPKVCG